MEPTFTGSSWCSGSPTPLTNTSSTAMAGCLQWQCNSCDDKPPQQANWAPSSSLRADATQDRFTMPKASVAIDGRGVATLGLKKKPTLRINGPAFEQAKAQQNYEHMLAQQAGQQTGRRFAAAHEFNQQVQQQRAREEEEAQRKTLAGVTNSLNMLPKYLTSDDNVLADTLTISPAKPSSSSCSSSRPTSRPHSPEFTARAHQKALRGHLTIGSLLPEAEPESEGAAAADEEDEDDEAEENISQLGVVAAAEAAHVQACAKKWAMAADYPHGAPVSMTKGPFKV